MTHFLHTLRFALDVSVLALATTFFSVSAMAQFASPTPAPVTIGSAMARLHPQDSVSLGGAAQFTAPRLTNTMGEVLTTSVSPSAQVFATFRQSFKPTVGYSVNFGYSRASDRYSYSPRANTSGYTSETNLQVHLYEISVSYIAQQTIAKRVSLFEEVGAGTLAFATINNGVLPSRSNSFLFAGIGGIGIDYPLSHGFGLRTQYRGLLVHHPFPNDSDSPKLRTVVSTPTLSLTYTFGRRPAQKRP